MMIITPIGISSKSYAKLLLLLLISDKMQYCIIIRGQAIANKIASGNICLVGVTLGANPVLIDHNHHHL